MNVGGALRVWYHYSALFLTFVIYAVCLKIRSFLCETEINQVHKRRIAK